LSDDNPFYVIGGDGGLLDRPYKTSSVTLSPAERADLLVNFRQYETDDTLRLEARTRNGMGGMMDGMMEGEGGMMNGGGGMMQCNDNRDMGGRGMMMQGSQSSDEVVPIVEFRIKEETEDTFQLPKKLADLSFPDEADTERTRRFNLSMEMMQGSSINGRFFEMMRVDEEVHQGALEVWEFHGDRMMPHPMHIHSTQFKVLDRSGGELAPRERGWKDNVLVNTDETVRVLVKFDAPKGMYVFHCHNLEHADNGMMANFEIV
jgi:FtsP/CotA-like multicopper oxidase with cupredoxin domain